MEDKRYEGLIDQVYVLLNMKHERGSLSSQQEAQLRELRDILFQEYGAKVLELLTEINEAL